MPREQEIEYRNKMNEREELVVAKRVYGTGPSPDLPCVEIFVDSAQRPDEQETRNLTHDEYLAYGEWIMGALDRVYQGIPQQ